MWDATRGGARRPRFAAGSRRISNAGKGCGDCWLLLLLSHLLFLSLSHLFQQLTALLYLQFTTSPLLLSKLTGGKQFVLDWLLLHLILVRFEFKTPGFLLLQSKLFRSDRLIC